jgi:hypothetical protein
VNAEESSGFEEKKFATPCLTFELKLLSKSCLIGTKVLTILEILHTSNIALPSYF